MSKTQSGYSMHGHLIHSMAWGLTHPAIPGYHHVLPTHVQHLSQLTVRAQRMRGRPARSRFLFGPASAAEAEKKRRPYDALQFERMKQYIKTGAAAFAHADNWHRKWTHIISADCIHEKQRCSEEGGRVLVESAQFNLRTAKLQCPVFHAVAQGIPAPETLACPPEFGQKDKVIRQIWINLC